MANDNSNAHDFPRADSFPQLSRGSATAPWTGRRMYASGPKGVRLDADETEQSSDLGVAESAAWEIFRTRILKTRP